MTSKTPFLSSLLLSALMGCEPAFTEPQVLGGETVSAATLNEGKSAYSYYCISCHGADGDGRGRSSTDLSPPPRDLRTATYKFTGTSTEYLPTDAAIEGLLRGGLHGTAMLEWELPDEVISPLVQYLKTFSPEGEGWRDPDSEVGEPYSPGDDPWADSEEAIAQGETLYHSVAECSACHPAYQTRAATNADREKLGMSFKSDFRPNRWRSKPKESKSYSIPISGDPTCSTNNDCNDGDQVCRYGRCEQPLMIVPPDFSYRKLRKARDLATLAQIVGIGIPGTAMPAWSETLSSKEIWAIAHFVNSLTALKGTPGAARQKAEMEADTGPISPPTIPENSTETQ